MNMRHTSRGSRAANGGGVMRDMQDKLGGMFGDMAGGSERLPMYKDKPSGYAASGGRSRSWSRGKTVWGICMLGILCFLFVLGTLSSGAWNVRKKGSKSWFSVGGSRQEIDWGERREKVKEAFTQSWDAYERYAWGYDSYHPVSRRGNQMTPGGMGWVIIDALDSLILMNLTSRLTRSREWISTKLDFDQDSDVNTFEATTRLLGGLLSAHYLSTTYADMAPVSEDDEGTEGEDLYLEKAKDLVDRLMGAFETQSGIPTTGVNLKNLKSSLAGSKDGASASSEVASLQLEMKYISKVTGETFYWQQAEKVLQIIDDNGFRAGLVPDSIDPVTGRFRGETINFGGRGSSYYGSLVKQFLQTSKEEPVYEELWDEACDGIRRHLLAYSSPSQFAVLVQRLNGLEGGLSTKMEHAVCSLSGILALSSTGGTTESDSGIRKAWTTRQQNSMDLAQDLMKTCWAMNRFTATGLAANAVHFDTASLSSASIPGKAPENFDDTPEATWRRDFTVQDGENGNFQQSQTVESLFYMWRITGDIKYREWGWELFTSFLKHTAVEENGGFTSLANANVIPPITADNMGRSWLPETLKYFYLLFSPDDLLPLDGIVVNTAGHVLPRFKLGPLLSTGWKRKSRGRDWEVPSQSAVTGDAQVVQQVKEVESGSVNG